MPVRQSSDCRPYDAGNAQQLRRVSLLRGERAAEVGDEMTGGGLRTRGTYEGAVRASRQRDDDGGARESANTDHKPPSPFPMPRSPAGHDNDAPRATRQLGT